MAQRITSTSLHFVLGPRKKERLQRRKWSELVPRKRFEKSILDGKKRFNNSLRLDFVYPIGHRLPNFDVHWQCMENPTKWSINALQELPICVHRQVALIGDAVSCNSPHLIIPCTLPPFLPGHRPTQWHPIMGLVQDKQSRWWALRF